MWIDARINSIHKQFHEFGQGSCQLHLNFYDDQGSLDKAIKTLYKFFFEEKNSLSIYKCN